MWKWHPRRVVPHLNSSSGMPSVPHTLKHPARADHEWSPWRSQGYYQHWREEHSEPQIHQHWWDSRKGSRTSQLVTDASSRYGMELSAEKTKLTASNNSTITADILVLGQKLETGQQFKYLGATISDEGSKPEILIRAAQTMTTIGKLETTWWDKNITLKYKTYFYARCHPPLPPPI